MSVYGNSFMLWAIPIPNGPFIKNNIFSFSAWLVVAETFFLGKFRNRLYYHLCSFWLRMIDSIFYNVRVTFVIYVVEDAK